MTYSVFKIAFITAATIVHPKIASADQIQTRLFMRELINSLKTERIPINTDNDCGLWRAPASCKIKELPKSLEFRIERDAEDNVTGVQVSFDATGTRDPNATIDAAIKLCHAAWTTLGAKPAIAEFSSRFAKAKAGLSLTYKQDGWTTSISGDDKYALGSCRIKSH